MKKCVCCFLTIIFIMCLLAPTSIQAASGVPDPIIKIKKINKGTGVRITIKNMSEYKGVETIGLQVNNNEFSDYLEAGAKEGYYPIKSTLECISPSEKTGQYTINGLPKGTYTILVSCCTKDDKISKEVQKSFKIKEAPKKEYSEQKYDFSDVEVGDVIKVGRYEQDGIMTNGKEEVEWIVLSKSKSKILVLSKYALAAFPFSFSDYPRSMDTSWEGSAIRDWLNTKFYKDAFSKNERAIIATTKLKNPGSKEYGTGDENTTKDKVFLLSLEDVNNDKYGFITDRDRKCQITKYAMLQNVDWDWARVESEAGSEKTELEFYCGWWLRSSGMESWYKSVVYKWGKVNADGWASNTFGDFAIRPAMYIEIK